MFFKKNKPAPLPEAESQASARSSVVPEGQSVFAPRLNVPPAKIDFGFNQVYAGDDSPPAASAPTPSWEPEAWRALPDQSDSEMSMPSVIPVVDSAVAIEVSTSHIEYAEPLPAGSANAWDPLAVLPSETSSLDMSPEEVWSMMEPSPAIGTASEIEEMASMPSTFELSASPSFSEASQDALSSESDEVPASAPMGSASQEEAWASAFGEDIPETAIPLMTPTTEMVAPPVDLAMDWQSPAEGPIDWGAEANNFVVPYHEDVADKPAQPDEPLPEVASVPLPESDVPAAVVAPQEASVSSPPSLMSSEPVSEFLAQASTDAMWDAPVSGDFDTAVWEVPSLDAVDSDPLMGMDVTAFVIKPIVPEESPVSSASVGGDTAIDDSTVVSTERIETEAFALDESSLDAWPASSEMPAEPLAVQELGVAPIVVEEPVPIVSGTPVTLNPIVPLPPDLWGEEGVGIEGSFGVAEPVSSMDSTFGQALWEETPAAQIELEQAPALEWMSGESLSDETSTFDPISASQELSAGWAALETQSESGALGFDLVDDFSGQSTELQWAAETPPVQASQQALAQEWANMPLDDDPVYMYPVSTTPQTEAALWNNLNAPDSVVPGDQVPLASGAYMDTINEQLYPADPFSGLNDEFSAGEQAFAEAAQYLFPETMTAPLEWSEESYGAQEVPTLNDDDYPVLELGPSYVPQAQGSRTVVPQKSTPGLSDYAGAVFYAEPVAPHAEAFVGDRQTLEALPGASSSMPFVALQASEAPPETAASSRAAWGPSAVADNYSQSQAAFLDMGPSMPVYEPLYSLPEPDAVIPDGALAQPSVVAAEEQDFYATAFTLNDTGELVPLHEEELLIELPPLPQPKVEPDTVAFEPELTADAVAHWGEDLQQAFTELADPAGAVHYAQPAQPQAASMDASAWSGSVISLEPSEGWVEPVVTPPFPASFASTEDQVSIRPTAPAPSLDWQDLIAPYVANPVNAPSSAPRTSVKPTSVPNAVQTAAERVSVPPTPEGELPPEKRIIHPKPLNRKMPDKMPDLKQQVSVSPSVVPVVSVANSAFAPSIPALSENQPQVQGMAFPAEPATEAVEVAPIQNSWYESNESVDSGVATPVVLPALSQAHQKLAVGNLEVRGLCQLSPDKRLMVVHSDGVYALMAQSGPGQSDVTVLKVFEQNPLAYQNTFTAVEEVKASGQGMFVTQVGTWRAIISTFQDKITLHTELG